MNGLFLYFHFHLKSDAAYYLYIQSSKSHSFCKFQKKFFFPVCLIDNYTVLSVNSKRANQDGVAYGFISWKAYSITAVENSPWKGHVYATVTDHATFSAYRVHIQKISLHQQMLNVIKKMSFAIMRLKLHLYTTSIFSYFSTIFHN